MMSELPLVSVIMPIRNEEAFIRRSLSAILEQDYPPDLVQVVIADGMSDDRTRDIVRSTMAEFPNRQIELVDNPHRTAPAALNEALRRTSGEVIVRVDGHCEISPEYVRRCVTSLRETGAANVGGLQRARARDLKGRAIALATSSPFGVGNARFRYSQQPGWVDTVYLGAWPREIFDEIGGFDEDLVRNQDDEFNFRLRQNGGRVWLDPAIESVYYSRPTLRSLWRQYYLYGVYKVRVMQKRRAVPSWRSIVPAAFVLGLLVSLFTLMAGGPIILGVVVPVAYLTAIVAFSLATARNDRQTLPILPAAFFILHAAYGSGFLVGLWRWRRYFSQP